MKLITLLNRVETTYVQFSNIAKADQYLPNIALHLLVCGRFIQLLLRSTAGLSRC